MAKKCIVTTESTLHHDAIEDNNLSLHRTKSNQLGIRHVIRSDTAYLSSWIEALENDPKKTQAAADEQRGSDGLMACEHERGTAAAWSIRA